jgi:hypothetical protein
VNSRHEELMRLIQTNKTYLSNINQQLLKPAYQNDTMILLKKEVEQYVKYLESMLDTHLTDCLFYMLYELGPTEQRFL